MQNCWLFRGEATELISDVAKTENLVYVLNDWQIFVFFPYGQHTCQTRAHSFRQNKELQEELHEKERLCSVG